MYNLNVVSLTSLFLLPVLCWSQDPSANLFVNQGVKLEKLWGAGEFTEGACLGPDEKIYFSDIGNRIMCFDPKTMKTDEYRSPSGRANGLKFNFKGELIACEGANVGGNRALSITKGNKRIILADKWDGKKFNSPNDLALDNHGGVYFSDPRYLGDEKREIDSEAVYYVSLAGKVSQLITDLKKPNGLVISPDYKTLYVAEADNSPRGHRWLLAYSIIKPGTLDKAKLIYDFKQDRGIDGMTITTEGLIVATAGKNASAGVYLFSPAGKKLGFVATPEDPTNVCFAGKDMSTLYITAGKSLYRIETKLKGFPMHGKIEK